MSNINLVRLTTGEEIIFKMIHETTETCTMESPMIMRVVPQGQEQYGLAMIPYSPSIPDGTHTLMKHHIVAKADNVPSNLEKAYLQQISGIEIVSAL